MSVQNGGERCPKWGWGSAEILKFEKAGKQKHYVQQDSKVSESGRLHHEDHEVNEGEMQLKQKSSFSSGPSW